MKEVEIDARIGGSFRFVDDRRNVEHTGVFLEIDTPKRLVFALSLEGEPAVLTRVTVEIVRQLNNCVVAVVHDGVPRHRAREIAARWCGMLYGLDETLESGPSANVWRVRPPFAPTPAYRSAP